MRTTVQQCAFSIVFFRWIDGAFAPLQWIDRPCPLCVEMRKNRLVTNVIRQASKENATRDTR